MKPQGAEAISKSIKEFSTLHIAWDQAPQMELWSEKERGETDKKKNGERGTGSLHSSLFLSPRSFSLHNPNCGAWS